MPENNAGMPRTIRTGLFVLLGIVLFIGALFVLGARKQLFEDRIKLYGNFDDVAGLQEGAFIRIAGINVGTVSRISLPDSVGNVVVEFDVRGDALTQIHKDSRAVIGTEGLIGARIVLITHGSISTGGAASGDTIVGQSPIRLHEFQEDIDQALKDLPGVMLNAGVTLASLRSIMEKIDAGQGTIGRLVNQRTLHDSALAVVSRVREVAASADRVLRTVQIEASVLSEDYSMLAETLRTAASDLRGTAHHVTQVMVAVREGRGTLGRLITDDSLYTVLTHMVASGDTMLNQASGAIDDITQASVAIASAAQEASVTIQEMTEGVRRGEGTLGKFVTDDSVYVRLNRMLLNLQIASEKAAVNMEAVRTNWLFRGYFDEQGYWDAIDRQIELQEQRAIRLREWEDRLLRLQRQLEAMERNQEEQSGAPPTLMGPVGETPELVPVESSLQAD